MLGKSNPDLWQTWVSVWQALIVALLLIIKDKVKTWKDKRSKPHHSISETSNQSAVQTEILERLRIEFNAMRAYLTKFHNGDQYIDGSDILRKSRVAEVVREGVSHETNRFRAILISTISDEMKFIQADGPGWFKVDELHLSNFRQMMEECGVGCGARQGIYKKGSKQPIGFIGLDFDKCEKPFNLEEKLKEYANWIEQTL